MADAEGEADGDALGASAAEGSDGAESGGSGSGCDTSERGSADEAPESAAVEELRAALRDLGGRGGGLRAKEEEKLERLSRREPAPRRRARGDEDVCVRLVAGELAEGDRSRRQAAFHCEMFMTKDRGDAESEGRWRCLTCDDEDDFAALTKERWGFFGRGGSLLWEAGDPVLLWDAAEVDLPFNGGAERFQRFGVVTAAEAAGADKAKVKSERPLVRNPQHNLPIASDQAGATRSKVILKVLAEPELDRIPEVHVELPARAADGCTRTAIGRCLRGSARRV